MIETTHTQSATAIDPRLENSLRLDNPWWSGSRSVDIPVSKRWIFQPVLDSVISGMSKGTVLRGPRQVGKSTVLNHCIESLLISGVNPKAIFRIQFDALPRMKGLVSPILDLVYWYADHVLKKPFIEAAKDGTQVYLFFDEIQNLPDWSPQLKHLIDMQPVRVMVTGSSALRIRVGHDSLAGRITTFELGPLLLREVADLRGIGRIEPYLPYNGLGPLKDKSFWTGLRRFGETHTELRHAAFESFSERGSYPIAQNNADQPWEKVAEQIKETVIERAIQHDLRMGPRGQKRDELLLRELFRLVCRYAGQSPSPDLFLSELRRNYDPQVGIQRVLNYLNFLDGTMLVGLIEPLELRLKKTKGRSKICLCDHALRAAWLQEVVPLTSKGLLDAPHMAGLAGHIAESIAGYFFKSMRHLQVAHFPERSGEPEVDLVLTVGLQRIPIEIKYRRKIEFNDSSGLRGFMDKPHNEAPFGIIVTLMDEPGSDDPRIVSMPLSTLLLMR